MDQIPEIETPKTPSTGADVETQWKNPNLSTLDDFRQLETGSQIEIQRLSPNQIKGYCGHLVVPDGGIADVMEELKQSYGGGRYQLRGKHLAANGRLNYVAGSVQVDVAGYPRDAGKEWINGVWRPIAMPPAGVAPVSTQSNNTPGQSSGMEGLMTTFLTQALQGALSGDGGISLGDMPALITSIAGLHRPTQERDAFGELERMYSLVDKLESRRSRDPDPAPVAQEATGSDGMLQMLAMKFLGNQNQPPPPNYAQQMHGNAPPNYAQPPQFSGQQMWEHAQSNAQQGGYPAQPAAGAGWTEPQTAAQPNHTPWPAAPPQPHQPAPPPSPQPAPATAESEYEPITPADVMEELAGMDETNRLAFLDDLCGKLGISDALAGQLFPGRAPVNGTQAPMAAPPSTAPKLDNTFDPPHE